MIIYKITWWTHVFNNCFFFYTGNWSIFNFYRKKVLTQSKMRKEMIGDHILLRENNDLSLWWAPAIKKKPPFLWNYAQTSIFSKARNSHNRKIIFFWTMFQKLIRVRFVWQNSNPYGTTQNALFQFGQQGNSLLCIWSSGK